MGICVAYPRYEFSDGGIVSLDRPIFYHKFRMSRQVCHLRPQQWLRQFGLARHYFPIRKWLNFDFYRWDFRNYLANCNFGVANWIKNEILTGLQYQCPGFLEEEAEK